MKQIQKALLLLLICMITLVSCTKKASKTDIEKSLMTAMSNHLNADPRIDSSLIKFKVLSVTYYEEVVNYACEFKIEMKTDHSDTTGVMTARISKNFDKVIRNE